MSNFRAGQLVWNTRMEMLAVVKDVSEDCETVSVMYCDVGNVKSNFNTSDVFEGSKDAFIDIKNAPDWVQEEVSKTQCEDAGRAYVQYLDAQGE